MLLAPAAEVASEAMAGDRPLRVLVTGGAGFIGTNLTRWLLARTPHAAIVFDALTYAGHRESLAGLDASYPERFGFVLGDVADSDAIATALDHHSIEAVLHLAAESHVDRSIRDAMPFLRTNVLGTQVLLDACRERAIRMVHVSTDEVYGSLNDDAPPSRESDPLRPRSPYAASKAAADLLCGAAHATHGQDVVITRCTNNYGPYQFPEKLLPVLTLRAIAGRRLPLYGDGLHRRPWLHVDDHAQALVRVLEGGRAGAIYNIGAKDEGTNLEVARQVLDLLELPHDRIQHVADRPGHDRRYAVDTSRMERELGWRPERSFVEGLADTVRWYQGNAAWCDAVRGEAYRAWELAHYGADEAPASSAKPRT